ncbi:hypothetical protein [Flavobacterium oreochromis]|uniref:Uncharacterized protein n=2 Tax=Flavobacterium TaxID=237 RepID=A0A246GC96_9FLAO|nr:hypothetical protein [Flavobacterium oreochromis]OWP77910.1 hypothetical protein BWG23_03805 [Flavobacterium oreochromis]OWP78628.1 hypothetical protein BWK62_04730 [Flavobacterium oreochromis]POR30599.1 hypothetical protein BWK58_01025 [Flavobacterium columnare]QYS85627.1 hypothetical protein JJC03_10490 [Flavobacterium oreochromis]
MTSNNETYTHFLNLVHESISNKTFAKLTLAKTIGKPELQNIYIKLTQIDGELKLIVTHKIYKEGLQEIEKIVKLKELENETIPYIQHPFMSALLFTTEADITMKINKKRTASIIEQPPTFKNADSVFLNL